MGDAADLIFDEIDSHFWGLDDEELNQPIEEPGIWRQANGEEIPMGAMTLGHLINAERLAKRHSWKQKAAELAEEMRRRMQL